MAPDKDQARAEDGQAELERRAKLAGWQIALLIVSVLVMFAGVALGITGTFSGDAVQAEQQQARQAGRTDKRFCVTP